jgi:dienelactone hydrolase
VGSVVLVVDLDGPMGCENPEKCTAEYLQLPDRFPFQRSDRGGSLAHRIEDALSGGQLLAGVHRRALTVRTIRDGDLRSKRYRAHTPPVRERDVVLEDPFLGSWDAILLTPRDAPAPTPGLVLIPGHTESAAFARDELFGAWFAGLGYAVLIPTPRANDAARVEDRVTRTLRAGGTSFQAVRAVEVIRAGQALAAFPEVDGTRIALLGHSGGSTTNNLVVHLTDTYRALVSDLATTYEGGNHYGDTRLLLEENTPRLVPLADEINRSNPVPTLRVPYGLGPVGDVRTFLGTQLSHP